MQDFFKKRYYTCEWKEKQQQCKKRQKAGTEEIMNTIAQWMKQHGVDLSSCSDKEAYAALLCYIKEAAEEKRKAQGKKRIYYISAEFLIGRLLTNNLINLGIYEEVSKVLREAGKDLGVL